MQSHLERPGLDWLTGFLIPACIAGMIGSLAYFLIDLRALAVAGGETVLRWVTFWFLIASVWIGIIRRQYGSDLMATPYLVALAVVIGLFVFVYTTAFGDGNNPGVSLLVNYLIVGMVWWAAHVITADCTLEAEDVEGEERESVGVGEDGGVEIAGAQRIGPAPSSAPDPSDRSDPTDPTDSSHSSEPPVPPPTPPARRPASPPQRRRVGRSVLLFSGPALLTFAVGQRMLAAGGRERDSHALACMVVYVVCAMALLSLTSLSGLRLYLRLRRARVPGGMALLWLALSALSVAAIVLLAGALPRTYEGRARSVYGPRRSAGYLRWSHPWMERLPFRGDSRPTGSPLADERGTRIVRDPRAGAVLSREGGTPAVPGDEGAPVSAPGGRGAGSAPGSGEGRSARADSREAPAPPDSSRRAPGGEEAPQAAAPTRPPAGDAGPSRAAEAEERTPEGSAPPPSPAAADAGERDGAQPQTEAQVSRETPPSPPVPAPSLAALLWIGAAAALVALLFLARRLPGRLLGLLRRLHLPRPELPAWLRRGGKAGGQAGVGDPFADPGLSPVERIERAYLGLLSYAEALGCPRRPEETPLEYGRRLPPPLHRVRAHAVELTRLYMLATYAGQEMGEEQVSRARAAWAGVRDGLEAQLNAAD